MSPTNLGVPMLSEGVASYALNSSPQKFMLLRCMPILEKAIALQQESLLKISLKDHLKAEADNAMAASFNDVFRIADMGSSSGPNCLASMQFMVHIIRKYHRYEYLQGFFCDLPSNDFNALFQLLHAHHLQYPALDLHQSGAATQPAGSFFGATVAGSVYGRLFPVASLHLVFSSCCLHWLSQVPKAVSTPGTMEWNKGKIWVDGPLANEATGRAYANQWKQDLCVFLECRNVELAKGGMMFLVILCRPLSFPPHQMQNESCFRNLELSWQQLIQEGVLEQSDLDNSNLPIYLPTPEEITTVVHTIPNLKIESLEYLEDSIGDNYWRQLSHNSNEWAKRVNNFYKSLFWNVFEGHVGPLKCEAIFKRFRKLLKKSLESQTSWDPYWAYPWPSFVVVQIHKDI